MKRSLFLLALETSAKAIRTGFGVVGALTDCGMRGPQVRWADALADKEAEEDVAEPNPLAGLAARMDRFEAIMLAQAVHEAPLSADFDDEPLDMHPDAVYGRKYVEQAKAWDRLKRNPDVMAQLAEAEASMDQARTLRFCDDCGHPDQTHKTGAGPTWPCTVRGCHCYDILFMKTPAAGATVSAVEDPSPDVPPASGEADSTWIDYVTPAITDVLADHEFIDIMTEDDPRWKRFGCYHMGELRSHFRITDAQDWRKHVAPLIAARLEAVTLELPEAQ